MKNRILAASILALILILIFLPIKISSTVRLKAQLAPRMQWQIIQPQNGLLSSMTNDNYTGLTTDIFLVNPDRGDQVSLQLVNDLGERTWIPRDYPIGKLTSVDWTRQIAELQGELEIARSNLQNLSSGNKTSEVSEIEFILDYSKKVAEQQSRILERLRALHTANLIAEEEFELETNKYELDLINIEIAEAQLRNVLSGAKPEELAVEKSRITAIQNQLDILEIRSAQLDISSPIQGVLCRSMSPDTLIQIFDTSEMVAVIPVPLKHLHILQETEKLDIKIKDDNNTYPVKSYRYDTAVRTIAGQQVLLLFCLISNENEKLMPGFVLSCQVKCSPVKPLTHVLRFFQ